MEVSPARLELSIPADGETQGTLEVSNPSPKTVQVRVTAGPYRYFQSGVRLPSAEEWFTFEPSSFTLGPNSQTTVSYTIVPPANIAQDSAAEYLAAVLADQLPAEGASPAPEGGGLATTGGVSQASVTVVPRFALPVYLSIQGRQRWELELISVSIRQGRSPDIARIQVKLKNTGSVHLRPTGSLVLMNEEGRTIEGRSLGRLLPLFPAATMEVPALIPLPPAGRYRVAVSVSAAEGQLIQKETTFEITPEGQVR